MDQKSEHLKVWAKNKNKNLMGIAQKIKNRAKKKSKNRANFFLGGDQITKIRTKFYIFFLFFLLLFFFPYLGGGGGGDHGPPRSPLPPSLIACSE
jgi:hypothetical protein